MKIAHVCLYPEPGQKHIGESGVASYTKNLLTNMPAGENIKHFVLCSRYDGKDAHYQDGDITVIRCFDRNIRFVWQVNKQLKKLMPDVVHIQHELSLFGGPLTYYLLSLLIFWWRQKTTITLHGVLSAKDVNKTFVKANNYAPAPVWLVKFGLKIMYWPLAHWPKRIVVHEQHFKRTLVGEYGAAGERVAVIPHGVEAFEPINKAAARRQLGIGNKQKVILFMGYAAGYKGIDLLIEGFAVFAKNNPGALLIVGAGVHPKLKNDSTHLAVYEGYQQKAAKLIPKDHYRWVGFIPEDQVGIYYSAADVSLYPYTLALSSSGPMSFAIGHNKPFLASSAFANVFDQQFIFEPTPQALACKLQDFFDRADPFNEQISRLRSDRLWPRTSYKTLELYKQIG